MSLTHTSYAALTEGHKEATELARKYFGTDYFLWERSIMLLCAIERELLRHDDYFNRN